MKHNYDYPFKIAVSFEKVIGLYQARLETEQNQITKNYIESIIAYANKYPKLTEGLVTDEDFKQHHSSIKIMLDDIFPNMLSSNEIKAASIPFKTTIFSKSNRLKTILEKAGSDYVFEPRDFNPEYNYLYACVIILNTYYGYNIDFFRPIYYDIPDEHGAIRNYRLFINADFVEIEPTEKAPKLTEEIVDKLIASPENIKLWKTYFPENSWNFKGFTLLNLTDITIDQQISNLKSILINRNLRSDQLVAQQLNTVFRNLFNIKDIEFGFTLFNGETKSFERMQSDDINSFILGDIQSHQCENSLCHQAISTLTKDMQYFCVSDVKKYAEATKNNKLSQNLLNQNFHSCILAPISKGDDILGILEIVAKKKNQLNQINAIKLNDVLPYLYAAAERNKIEMKHRVKAVIQNKCTSIHKSVEWRFEEEARNYIKASDQQTDYQFKDIVFKDVHPLYGQIDIVASSVERNKTIVFDISNQLTQLLNIFKTALEVKDLPIYEQSIFRIEQYLKELNENFKADLEQKIVNLIVHELNPVLNHIFDEIPELQEKINAYNNLIKGDNVLIFNRRDAYDQTVQLTNEKIAYQLDRLQDQAQAIYPHYFERYKTDGVEHNLYIGQNITKYKKFSPILLQNLRIWQLEVMCKLENTFYKLQQNADVKLNAASMILAFNSTLSIRYRMDEKKFDVDGTYNARYEVIKKRIDKALIKNTDQRVTEKGKIAIIYTDNQIKRDYVKYIQYLQQKDLVGEKIEELDLEEVQGISGLKAIRVDVMYHLNKEKDHITYKDLVEILNH